MLHAGTLRAQGDTIHMYRFETGVDSALWLPLNTDTLSYATRVLCPIGFDFEYCDNIYSSLYVDDRAQVIFEGVYHTYYSMASTARNFRIIFPLGTNFRIQHGSYVLYQTLNPDSPGNRIFVLQLRYSHSSLNTSYTCQVQLREADQSVTLVYAPPPDQRQVADHYGMRDHYDCYAVNTATHTVQSQPPVTSTQQWPGSWRWYRFTPLVSCSRPHFHTLYRLTDVTACPTWAPVPRSRAYLVSYDTVGGAFDRPDTVVADTGIYLTGLLPDHDYEVRVRSICQAGDTSFAESLTFHTACAFPSHGIDYADIYAPNVTCRTGTFSSPSRNVGVVNFGSDSEYSRHTVHYNTAEHDFRTGYMLSTVPPGHCASVRLGNWRTGGEQEEIDYTLRVDTNQFDLLILRYALVEEQPNHGPNDQPKFELTITDSAGSLISECYHGNFVSGDNSGWTAYGSVVFRDWDAVGVDLGPMHGRLVHIKLSNYDCALLGHYGYAYFVLDTDVKSIRAKNCGEMDENTFYAPEGFTYRWYSAANPFQTLSTADSLHVTHTGRYCCQATYTLSGQTCSFTLSTDAYSRYPVAAFTPEMLDTCGALRHFSNQSVIARNSSRTDLTETPCESYLWDFGDGTTSTEAEPTHNFADGDFPVTLYAMLSDGQCVDTLTQIIRSHVRYDTIPDTICLGQQANFHGRMIDSGGTYSFNLGCAGERLQLTVWPLYSFDYYDTSRLGVPYPFGAEQYDRPGVYRQRLTSIGGCDSVQTLHLSTIEDRDSLACLWDMPLTWWGRPFADAGADTLRLSSAAGTDSIVALALSVRRPSHPELQVEPSCRPARYTLSLPDSMRYRWHSLPPDPSLEPFRQSSRVEIVPPVPTVYYYETDYPDAPSCPVLDSLPLDPPDSARVRLLAEPDFVTDEFPGYRVTDLDTSARRHAWYVSADPSDEGFGVPQAEASPRLFGLYPPAPDSIRVTAVGYNGPCADTAAVWIRKLRQELYFPNIFTPEAPTNNRFRGVGVGVRDYELVLFTKWGDQIFSTTDMQEGWDGTRNGQRCPADAYVYRCTYTSLTGRRQMVTGTVVLVR